MNTNRKEVNAMHEKEQYEELEIEVIRFEYVDVITDSPSNPDTRFPYR